MLRKSTFLMLLALTLSFTVSAQEVWSLQKCIDHARVNNLTLRQSAINVQNAEIEAERSKKARMPDLNAGTGYNLSFGRNIDPVTNQFVNTRFGSNNLSLNASINVYTGGRIKNSIEQSGHELVAATEDAKDRFQDIALQLAQSYLSLLLSKEQVNISQKALEQTQEQLTQIDKRINAGTVPRADRLELVAQIARNEQQLVVAQNNVDLNNLSLKNLLELEPDYNLEIEIPENLLQVEEYPQGLSLTSIYADSWMTQPSIKASEARIKSAEKQIAISKGQALPSIGLQAGLNSNYRSISGFPTERYFNQIENNFGQSVGAFLNIPIYQKHNVKLNIERAELGVINAQVQHNQAKQLFKADIQNALIGAKTARAELTASEKAVDAAKAVFENVEKRYNLGSANPLELTIAKTNLDTQELNVIRAKYDYVFRLKIIDFYLGKELTLN